ncbi:hypothetical protein DMC25_01870 [Caulobacter sp. D4A]|nr:hypothetical protein DMC25_01870 [Caulobacter sp. D4A]
MRLEPALFPHKHPPAEPPQLRLMVSRADACQTACQTPVGEKPPFAPLFLQIGHDGDAAGG